MMNKLNEAILEAYEDYHAALDYVQGWKQEAAHRKGAVMVLINAARKSNPELGVIPAKDLFTRTAEMWEASHTEEQEQAGTDPAEVEQGPAEVEQDQTEVEQDPAEVEQGQADEPQELNSVDA